METHHAPAYRKSSQAVIAEFNLVNEQEMFANVFTAFPCTAMVLNDERQMVYCNATLMSMLGKNSIYDLIGNRPGELMACVHSNENKYGCGTAQSCRYCGAVNVVLQSQQTKKPVTGECRITAKVNNTFVSYDFRVTCAPFMIDDKSFWIVVIEDISSDKRREVLEQVFLHDISNTLTGVTNVTEVLNLLTENAEQQTLLEQLQAGCDQLSEDIQAQRDLTAAEHNRLDVKVQYVSSIGVIKEALKCAHSIGGKYHCKIELSPSAVETMVFTDARLLRRVLINLIKNALEASKKYDMVLIGCQEQDGSVRFWVHNPVVMPEIIREQIFQRSFSTKGAGRGIGTYSVKLITEHYLKGTVDFISNPESGTVFNVYIPIEGPAEMVR